MQESQHMELKRQWKADLLKWMCPFAKSDGGVNRLFSYIKSRPGLSAKTISQATGIPLRTTERWLKELRDQGLIELKG